MSHAHTQRLSAPALQVACIVNDHDAKIAGMNEVINGGETSLGVQLRRLQTPYARPDPFLKSDTGMREQRVHCVAVAGDFPAMAAMLPSKGSTSAHRYDRKSTLDQTSDLYDKPFSLLHPQGEGAFRRLTYDDFRTCLDKAAQEHRVTYRRDILDKLGFDSKSFIFPGDGTWELNFALAGIPLLDWLRANSHDVMHTSLQGTVPLEIGLSQFMFIVVRGYYTRLEINSMRLEEGALPPGVTLPEFGDYIEKGRGQGDQRRPQLNGRVKFSASQSRVWLEYGTGIMERLFEKKVWSIRARATLRRVSWQVFTLCARVARVPAP